MSLIAIDVEKTELETQFEHLGYSIQVRSFDASNQVIAKGTKLYFFTLNEQPHTHKVFTTAEYAELAARKLVDFIMDDGA